MINFEGMPNMPSPRKALQQNKEEEQEVMESKSPLFEFNEKTAEVASLIEKGFEKSLSKKDKEGLESASKHLDEEILNFIEENAEFIWNFLQEKGLSLSEFHQKTDEIVSLMEKSISGKPLTEEDKKRMEEMRKSLDEETLIFIEEKVERKWNFIEEQQEEKEKSEREKASKKQSPKIENQVNVLREKRQKDESLVGQAINLLEEELGGTLSGVGKQRLEEIKRKLGKTIFDFIDEEYTGAVAFNSGGARGDLEVEKTIQKLINMIPEKMEKEARKSEKKSLERKKMVDELRGFSG